MVANIRNTADVRLTERKGFFASYCKKSRRTSWLLDRSLTSGSLKSSQE